MWLVTTIFSLIQPSDQLYKKKEPYTEAQKKIQDQMIAEIMKQCGARAERPKNNNLRTPAKFIIVLKQSESWNTVQTLLDKVRSNTTPVKNCKIAFKLINTINELVSNYLFYKAKIQQYEYFNEQFQTTINDELSKGIKTDINTYETEIERLENKIKEQSESIRTQAKLAIQESTCPILKEACVSIIKQEDRLFAFLSTRVPLTLHKKEWFMEMISCDTYNLRNIADKNATFLVEERRPQVIKTEDGYTIRRSTGVSISRVLPLVSDDILFNTPSSGDKEETPIGFFNINEMGGGSIEDEIALSAMKKANRKLLDQ